MFSQSTGPRIFVGVLIQELPSGFSILRDHSWETRLLRVFREVSVQQVLPVPVSQKDCAAAYGQTEDIVTWDPGKLLLGSYDVVQKNCEKLRWEV